MVLLRSSPPHPLLAGCFSFHFEDTNPCLIACDDLVEVTRIIHQFPKIVLTHPDTRSLLFSGENTGDELGCELGEFQVLLQDVVGAAAGESCALGDVIQSLASISSEKIHHFLGVVCSPHRPWTTRAWLILDGVCDCTTPETPAPKSHCCLGQCPILINSLKTMPNLDGSVACMKEELDSCALLLFGIH